MTEHWFHNTYHCTDCDVMWDDEWTATCDDKCPSCGAAWSPIESEDLNDEGDDEDGGEFSAGAPESTTAEAVIAEKPAKPASGHATKPGGPFRSELTPIGEQYVIPGCERDATPATKQLNLF